MTSEQLREFLAPLPEGLALLDFDAACLLDAKHDRGEWTLEIAPAAIRRISGVRDVERVQ